METLDLRSSGWPFSNMSLIHGGRGSAHKDWPQHPFLCLSGGRPYFSALAHFSVPSEMLASWEVSGWAVSDAEKAVLHGQHPRVENTLVECPWVNGNSTCGLGALAPWYVPQPLLGMLSPTAGTLTPSCSVAGRTAACTGHSSSEAGRGCKGLSKSGWALMVEERQKAFRTFATSLKTALHK